MTVSQYRTLKRNTVTGKNSRNLPNIFINVFKRGFVVEENDPCIYLCIVSLK